jgi:hypothetical protein
LKEQEVTLVFPKTSVVTQSIINLKLLAREGEKLQKILTIVSQNENARSLAEKLGFATLPYTSDLEKGNIYLQTNGDLPLTETTSKQNQITDTQEPLLQAGEYSEKLSGREIGSNSFHTSLAPNTPEPKTLGDIKITTESTLPIEEAPGVSLRVRNDSPERPPSLNSVRYQESLPESTPVTLPENNTLSGATVTTEPMNSTQDTRQTPLAVKNFFNREIPQAPVSFQAQKPPVTPVLPQEPQKNFIRKASIFKSSTPVLVGTQTSKKLRGILWVLLLVIVLSSATLFFFLVFPKALVSITPQTLEETTDQTFSVALAENSGGDIILEKISRELTVSIPGVASGASASTAASAGTKAKGKIKITNTYSSESQPLVATTRFATENGNVYRTPVAVTIPGNGSIEVEVIADGSGDIYNAETGTLRIPGLKGSDKYEKITATITVPLAGGGGETQSSGGTFIRADEEILRQRAADKAKQTFSDEVNNETGDQYTFIDGLVTERITEENIPKVGSTPGEYTYNAVFKVTAYTTSQEAVTKNLLRNIKTEYDGIVFTPIGQKLEFTDFTIDEKGERATLKAHLDTTLKAAINEDSVKKDLSGKSAEEMSSFTEAHPEIRSLEATFEPSWSLKRIPSDIKRIELLIQ